MPRQRLAGALLLLGLVPAAVYAGGFCETDDGSVGVALTLASDGAILDLAVTEGEYRIFRYAEANGSKIVLPAYLFGFSAAASKGNPAIKLDVAGKRAGMRWRGKLLNLECSWD